jgi:hypothetical protein
MNAADRQLERLVDRVPEGWTRVAYEDRTYGLSRTTGVNGRSIKILARELGGDDLISANIYATSSNGHQLRACEMPDQKVLDFLRGWNAADVPEVNGGALSATPRSAAVSGAPSGGAGSGTCTRPGT